MRPTRRTLALGLPILLALLALGWLAGGDRVLSGLRFGEGTGEGELAPDAVGVDLDAVALEEAGRLQAFPGLQVGRTGTGSIVGSVSVHVPGEGPRPLPGAHLEARVAIGGRTTSATAETDAQGRFTLAPVPAVPGWVLLARHAPHADLVVRGLSVMPGRATEAGALVFGAATSLAGTVVDAVGRPVAGARVAVEGARAREGGGDLLRSLRELATGAGPMAEGRTEADGTFELTGLAPGRYLVRVTRSGYAEGFARGVAVTLEGDAARVRVVLDAGAGFEGRVVEEGGRGLAGAVVVALAVRTEKADALDRHETRADAEGRYRLDTLATGTTYFIEAHHPGFAPSGQLRPARGVDPLDFALVAGGRLEGLVHAATTHEPVPGAEVLAITGFVGRGAAPVSTVADAAGRYVLENVAPGPLVLLEVRAPGFGPVGLGYDAKAPRTVRAGETLVVDVEVAPGGVVTGLVRGADGRPLPFVSVAATRPNDRLGGEVATLTEADGTYELLGLRWGSHVLALSSPGYAAPVEEEAVRVEVNAAAPAVVRDFVLTRGATVRGRLTTPDGAPAAGATATVQAQDLRRYGTRVRDLVAVADRQGSYRVVGVPAGLDLVVVGKGETGVPTTSPAFRARAGTVETIDLALARGARIVGRVIDGAGRGVASASARFGHLEAAEVGRVSDSYRAEEFLVPRTFRADADGRFVCEDVPPGRTLLKVEAEGFAPWFRRDLVVPDEGDLLGLTITLDGARGVQGRVTAADTGRPVAGAWVYARTRDAQDGPADEGSVRTVASGETRSDGTYELLGLSPGVVEVAVWLALGYRNAWEDPAGAKREAVPAGSTGIDFRLTPQVEPPR